MEAASAAQIGHLIWDTPFQQRHTHKKKLKLWVFLGTTQQLPSDKAFRGGSNVGGARPGPD